MKVNVFYQNKQLVASTQSDKLKVSNTPEQFALHILEDKVTWDDGILYIWEATGYMWKVEAYEQEELHIWENKQLEKENDIRMFEVPTSVLVTGTGIANSVLRFRQLNHKGLNSTGELVVKEAIESWTRGYKRRTWKEKRLGLRYK